MIKLCSLHDTILEAVCLLVSCTEFVKLKRHMLDTRHVTADGNGKIEEISISVFSKWLVKDDVALKHINPTIDSAAFDKSGLISQLLMCDKGLTTGNYFMH